MDKNGVITISEWQKGAAISPFYGFGSVKNCEVFDLPGILKIANSVTPKFTPSGIPIAYLKASTGDEYVLNRLEGGNSTLTKNGSYYTNVAGDAWDMIEYKGFIIISSTVGLHCFGILSSTFSAYFSTFQTGLTSDYYIKMLVGQNGDVYLTNGNYIASFDDITFTGFLTPPTLGNWTLSALDLKNGQYAVTIEELGTKIMIGTQGGGSWSARGSQRVANIYSWNRKNAPLGSPGIADLPIKLNECGVHAMLSIGNILYVVAGTKGNIYKTDGTSVIKINRIPFSKDYSYNSSIAYYPNAMFLNSNGNLLVGVSQYSGTTNNTGVYEINISGKYEINTSGKYEITLKHIKESSNIGVISGNEQNTIFIGWQKLNTYGLDYTIGIPYSNFSAEVESQVYIVGNALKPKTFEHIDFTLSKPITNQQDIKLFYRKNTETDYTLIGQYNLASIGSTLAFEDIVAIADAQLVQFKIQLSQDNQASPVPLWDLELLNVRIW